MNLALKCLWDTRVETLSGNSCMQLKSRVTVRAGERFENYCRTYGEEEEERCRREKKAKER